MANTMTAAVIRKQKQQYRIWGEALRKAQSAPDTFRTQIQEAADALLLREARDVFDRIPVEDLNRDKRGFRVKLLRDSGYESLYDVLRASVDDLIAINGISEEGAIDMAARVRELYAEVRSKTTHVRLSADQRTPEATRLLTTVWQYSRSLEPAEKSRSLGIQYGPAVETALREAEPGGKNALVRLFTSSAKKERAQQAAVLLQTLAEGEYGQEAGAIAAGQEALEHLSDESVWQAFSADPIAFINTLEAICPGLLGSGQAAYGLPETLAADIQAEPLHLEGLRCQLRRYQEQGVQYILHQKRVLLGDEMGLGKTVQAIAAMVSLRNEGEERFLVICPASVLENWCREIVRHSDLPVIKVHGNDKIRSREQWMQEGGVAVTTYETSGIFCPEPEQPEPEKTEADVPETSETSVMPAASEHPEQAEQPAFTCSMVIVDEAHYIKNPAAKRTKNVKNICAHAGRLLFMTGTALENRVEEMITLIGILQPDVAAQVRGMEALASAPQFREQVVPVYYRRKRDDVLTELPDLIEKEEWCELFDGEEEVYEQAVLEGRYADARRVSWNVPANRRSCKAERLLELVEEAAEDGRKIIVFSFFLDTIRRVTDLLGERCLPVINGSVPPQERQEILDTFNASPAGSVLPAQIQAGGTGLNIQAASVVILCEPQFKPSIENQAIARAYRMGQTRNVLVYRLLCENTVDERMMELLEEKQTAFDAFADISEAAGSLELDDASFGAMMKEEAERIRQKHEEAS